MREADPVLADVTAEPVTAGEFAQSMTAFAPFEAPPILAVGVSGGGDSMALALLAAEWARAEGGAAWAVTVDHGLRSESAAEAGRVAAWCEALGIAQATLRWAGPAPATGVQEAARDARYALLEKWCAERHVLHLLLAHQREDQAETVLMRRLRQSGVEGLAGMSAVHERRAIRVLRPLLRIPRARLHATLRARGQDWIEDPSNRNPLYTRAALRARASDFAAQGDTEERLLALAEASGRARCLAEAERAALLARAVMLHPAGFAWLDPAPIAAAAPEAGARALGAVIATVAGSGYPPRREALDRLVGEIRAGFGPGRSLGGCLILPRRHKLLICREPACAAPPLVLVPGQGRRWDGRFRVDIDSDGPADLTLGALGDGEDAREIRRESPAMAIPAAAWPSLPALRDRAGIVAVPGCFYAAPRRPDVARIATGLKFRPTRPLAGAGFRIV